MDCVQLRYLQTLNNIAAENNSTVIFPVPIDVISQLMGKDSKVRKRNFLIFHIKIFILERVHKLVKKRCNFRLKQP